MRTRLLGGHKLPCKNCGKWVTVDSMVKGRCMRCYIGDCRCPVCQAELYEHEDKRNADRALSRGV